MKIFKKFTALLTISVLCLLMSCSDSTAEVSSVQSANKSNESSSTESSLPKQSSAAASRDSSSAISSRDTSSAVSSRYYSSATPSRYTSSKYYSSTPVSSALSSTKPNTNGKINSVENIINDMKLAHEGLPHGVPQSYDWAKKPRVGMGVNLPDNWNASTAWGQVYEAAEGNPATNTRVQLRNMQMYYFSKSKQKWIKLQDTLSVTGSAYTENFQGNVNKSADQRDESAANGGGKSVKAGDGYNYHFWPDGGKRATLPAGDIAVIYSTCQARLIVDNPNKPDDRDSARYLLSVGGDYWYNTSIGWAEFKTNGDWAIGRFKYVTKEWQAFNGWAGDENILRNNPPPMM